MNNLSDKEKIRLLRLDIEEFNREKIRDLKDDIEDFDIEIFRSWPWKKERKGALKMKNQIKDWKKLSPSDKISTFLEARSWYGKVFENLVYETKLSVAELCAGDDVQTYTNREVKSWSEVEKKRGKLRAITELKDYLFQVEHRALKKRHLKEMEILADKMGNIWKKFWKLEADLEKKKEIFISWNIVKKKQKTNHPGSKSLS